MSTSPRDLATMGTGGLGNHSFNSRQTDQQPTGSLPGPLSMEMDMVESDSAIKVVSYSNNRGLKLVVVALAIWNAILTFFAWRNSPVAPIFHLGDNTATLPGRDLVIPGNLRVNGNLVVAAVGNAGLRGLGNIVIGDGHQFGEARNSLIVGTGNTVNGVGSSVLSGENNVVNTDHAAVVGGHFNVVQKPFATISGGEKNKAFGRASTVAGGIANTVIVDNGFIAPANSPIERGLSG